jgi:hypothetical protein
MSILKRVTRKPAKPVVKRVAPPPVRAPRSLPGVRLDQGFEGYCGLFAPLHVLNMQTTRPISQSQAMRLGEYMKKSVASATYSAEDWIVDIIRQQFKRDVRYKAIARTAIDQALNSVPLTVAGPAYMDIGCCDAKGYWLNGKDGGESCDFDHVVTVYGRQGDDYLILNSFGTGFGIDGTCRLRSADFRTWVNRGASPPMVWAWI